MILSDMSGRDPRSTGAALRATQRRLQAHGDVPTLLARAAEEARGFCGAERALVLRVQGTCLSAAGLAAIAHGPSDTLRRAVLAQPVELLPGTPEAEYIRNAEGGREAHATRPSRLSQLLDLDRPAVGVVAPEDRALAVVLVDGALTDGTAADREHSVVLFAHLLGGALDRAVQRARLDELQMELRHMTTSAEALMHEAATAPLTLPEDYGNGPVFRQVAAPPSAAADMRAVLTDRENDVMRLVVEGLSNRRIGEALFLSPATVKDHVARILGKLGAANRVDAVGIYLGLVRRH